MIYLQGREIDVRVYNILSNILDGAVIVLIHALNLEVKTQHSIYSDYKVSR